MVMAKRELVAALNSGIEHEMLVYFQFYYNSLTLTGHTNMALAEKFREESANELVHAQKLADRVVALGGTPSSNVPKVPRPKTPREMIKEAIKNEKTAVKLYKSILPQTKDDSVLYHLIFHILNDELGDLEEFESLL
ncbi:MAG: ferritin-like domain-containing protein [Candidatus Zixiibacteriota bacterium]